MTPIFQVYMEGTDSLALTYCARASVVTIFTANQTMEVVS